MDCFASTEKVPTCLADLQSLMNAKTDSKLHVERNSRKKKQKEKEKKANKNGKSITQFEFECSFSPNCESQARKSSSVHQFLHHRFCFQI